MLRMTRSVFLLLGALLVFGCAAPVPSDSPEDGSAPLRVIIAFTSDVRDPRDPALIGELSRVAGYELLYLRPMSGGAHVFSTSMSLPLRERKSAIERLAALPGVRYVEEDTLMKPLSNR